MIRFLLISWMSGTIAHAATEPSDLLRFTNGDQLHGTFQGLKDGPHILWQRDDVTGAVTFDSSKIRHVVLRGGRPKKSLTSISNISLVNGDRVPGRITAMDADTVTVDTSYAGSLTIPRAQVTMLAPSPMGGRLRYHGPFIEDEWRMAHASFPEGLPPAPLAEDDNTSKKNDGAGRWVFSRSAWYWAGKTSGTALIRDNAMLDRSVLRFDISWKNRLAIAIAFHADFKKVTPPVQDADGENPKPRKGRFAAGDSQILPILFGNSYVLQIFPNHMMMFRSSVSEDGSPSVEQVQSNFNAIRLGEVGNATVELRCNRLSGEICLFVNNEFVSQWSEDPGRADSESLYAGKGGGFGFVVQTEDSPVRISDVMVAEWNGMPDSARSLQVDEHDIVLLANGTDRFSGKVGSLRDGKILLEGKYGRFEFDLDDVAEIRFARDGLAKATEPVADSLSVHFSPLGFISGRPLAGDASSLRLLNPACGEIQLNLDAATLLDFQSSNHITDDWEQDF